MQKNYKESSIESVCDRKKERKWGREGQRDNKKKKKIETEGGIVWKRENQRQEKENATQSYRERD